MTDVLSISKVGFSYGAGALLHAVSFDIPEAGALIISGRSGCGKSTVLELCAGLRAPDSGGVSWEGRNIAGFNHEQMTAARKRIGFVFQKHALIHNFTIFDNIALPLRYHTDVPEKDIRAKVKNIMDELGLFNVDRKFPNELCAGQSKCAALARALILGPRILFADEPTAGVDPFTARCIASALNHLRESDKLTVCMVCNDVNTMRGMQCPIKILEEGRLFDVRDTGETGGPPVPEAVEYYREML